jgi:DNA-3-methyladenine glycosylase
MPTPGGGTLSSRAHAPAAFRPLPPELFQEDPVVVARSLLGAVLWRWREGQVCAVRLVETEAYRGEEDPGSHAYRGPTPRNRVMYGPGGRAYVYFTYGSHWLLNVVTGPQGQAGAVLLRGAEPVAGLEVLAAQRAARSRSTPPPLSQGEPTPAYVRWLLAGPARLAAALGVDGDDYGLPMVGSQAPPWPAPPPGRGFLLVAGSPPREEEVQVSGRIGLRHGAHLPFRFYLPSSPGVSPARPSA